MVTGHSNCIENKILYITEGGFTCENYVTLNLMKSERSTLCQLRFGILPLRIETGRYIGEPAEQRLCRICPQNNVENETHFQQCGILTLVDSDKPVQPPFKLRDSKCCSISRLTVHENLSDQQRLCSACALKWTIFSCVIYKCILFNMFALPSFLDKH